MFSVQQQSAIVSHEVDEGYAVHGADTGTSFL